VTSQLEIYSKRLGDEWEWIYPTQGELDDLVMPAIAAVKAGDRARGRTLFLEATNRLIARAVDVIVLACTEIPVVMHQRDVSVPAIDSTEALARYTIAAAQAMRARQQ
jgi:aspartate racemase